MDDLSKTTTPAPESALNSGSLFRNQTIVAFITVVTPAIGFAIGMAALFTMDVPLFYFGLWALMHYIGMVGISVGFHRLGSHSSFHGKTWIKNLLLIFGSLSAQGPVMYWVSNHRRHHHKCDVPGDVHSPYYGEDGTEFKNSIIGLWHAHTGWMFKSNPSNPLRYSLDLIKDKNIAFVNRYYYLWVLLGIVVPGLLAFAVYQTMESFLLGVLFGGLVRLFTVQHVTWAINSLTHMFGASPYRGNGHATNLWWLSFITAGEAWHNNHHCFPSSARLGLEWWEFDPGYITLKALEKLGLVWDLKIPSQDKKDSRRIATAEA